MNSPAALSPNPLSVAARFALIIDGLRAAVAARIGYYAVTAEMIVYVCDRLNRMNQRFQALAALILAGKPPAERVYQPRAARRTGSDPLAPDPGAVGEKNFFPIWRLVPTYRFAWLCMVAPNWAGAQYAAIYGDALRRLLDDPEMAALMTATRRMEKLLRPLCWGLGIEASLLRRRRAVAEEAVAEAESALVVTTCRDIVPDAGATATLMLSSTPPPETRTPANFDGPFFAPA